MSLWLVKLPPRSTIYGEVRPADVGVTRIALTPEASLSPSSRSRHQAELAIFEHKVNECFPGFSLTLNFVFRDIPWANISGSAGPLTILLLVLFWLEEGGVDTCAPNQGDSRARLTLPKTPEAATLDQAIGVAVAGNVG